MNTTHLSRWFLILLVALNVLSIARADDNQKQAWKLEGKVAYVIDGDDAVLLVDKIEVRIRLYGIDAPEASQPFGEQAKKALSDKILGKTVQVTTYEKDKYERVLGIIKLGDRNINLEMVKEGFAWHYKEFSSSKILASAQEDAKKAKIGLWADKNPTPPWQWRSKTNRENQADPFDEMENAQKTTVTEKDKTEDTKTEKTKAENTKADPTQKYWLSTSSNTRHNSKCRYYEKTKGRPCGPDDGKPCKICGG